MNIDQINIASYYELVLQPCSCWNLHSSIPAEKKLHSEEYRAPLRLVQIFNRKPDLARNLHK